jgi:hypothetical protein
MTSLLPSIGAERYRSGAQQASCFRPAVSPSISSMTTTSTTARLLARGEVRAGGPSVVGRSPARLEMHAWKSLGITARPRCGRHPRSPHRSHLRRSRRTLQVGGCAHERGAGRARPRRRELHFSASSASARRTAIGRSAALTGPYLAPFAEPFGPDGQTPTAMILTHWPTDPLTATTDDATAAGHPSAASSWVHAPRADRLILAATRLLGRLSR